MAISSLAKYKDLTPNKTNGRGGYKIVYIAIHHMAGNLSIEQCGKVFRNNEASAHYGIGTDGRVGCYVDEANTAWALGNFSYNCRSINIELANDGGASTGWHVSDKAIAKCIELVADIAYRHGWKTVDYTGNLYGDIIAHRWVVPTACPGNYMIKNNKLKYIANKANDRLQELRGGKKPSTTNMYRVRKTWADSKSQIGAYKSLENAKKACDKHAGYSVFDGNGKKVYPSSILPLVVDGEIGVLTSKALQMFLNKNGAKLDVDGEIGAKTIKALQTFLNSQG